VDRPVTFNDPRIQQYLATKDIVVLGTINPDGSPLVTAMWFLHEPAALTLISVDNLQKVKNLRRDPRLHIVAESGTRGADIKGVAVRGRAEFLADQRQVLDEGWLERLEVARRDVGTGMSDAEVDELSARIDLQALRGYWDAVSTRTLMLVDSMRGSDFEATVPGERVRSVVLAEDAVAPGAEWLTEFWAGGRTRAWVLAQTALLHPYGHYYEARVAAGLWGARSP